MLEPVNLCPYPRCTGEPAPGAARCPECARKLLICTSCGSANRAMATFCRQCGKALTPPDEWRLPRATSEQTGFVPAGLRLPAVGADALPRRHRRLECSLEAGPLAAYDLLFVPTRDRGLLLLRIDTLETVAALRSPFDLPLMHTPAIAGGYLFVVSPAGMAIYDLKRTLSSGTLAAPPLHTEPIRFPESVITSPLPVGERVYVGTTGGLYRLDLRGGEPQKIAAGAVYSLAKHGDCVAYTSGQQSLAGVDSNGVTRWETQLRRPQQTFIDIDRNGGFMSVGEQIIFADTAGELWALYPETGACMQLGRGADTVRGIAALPDGGTALATYAGLAAFDASGAPRWPRPVDEAVECAPVATRHLVLAGTNGGSLLLVDRLTGSFAKCAVGSGAVRGIAVSGSTVLAVTSEGDVSAYDLPEEEG